MDGFATVRKKIRFFFYTRRGGGEGGSKSCTYIARTLEASRNCLTAGTFRRACEITCDAECISAGNLNKERRLR